MSQIKINGPFYQRIVQGKDVIADILPPPEYLVETYLTAFQMLEDTTGELLPALMRKEVELRTAYLARHAYWEAKLPDDDLKRTLVEESFPPAQRLLDTLEKAFIPALQRGERVRAERLLRGSIRVDYELHRAKIDQVVKLAMRRNQTDEAQASTAIRSRTVGQIVLGIFLVGSLSSLSYYLLRQIETAKADRPESTRA